MELENITQENIEEDSEMEIKELDKANVEMWLEEYAAGERDDDDAISIAKYSTNNQNAEAKKVQNLITRGLIGATIVQVNLDNDNGIFELFFIGTDRNAYHLIQKVDANGNSTFELFNVFYQYKIVY